MNARVRTLVGIAGLAVAAGAALSGCSGEPAEAPELRNLAAENISNEVFQADDMSLIEYAANKLQADCMAKQGYRQLQQAGVKQNPKPFSDMDVMMPPFATATDDQARLLGFGAHKKAEKAHVVSYDAGFDRAFDRCRARAGSTLGPEYTETNGRVVKLYNDIAQERDNALETSKERAATRKALETFLGCLDKRGIRGPATGERNLDTYGIGRESGRYEGALPPAPKRVAGTVEIIPTIPERRYVPTPAESQLAVTAAQCSRETGFGEKLAEQRLRIVRATLAGHETEIAELRPKVESLAKKAAQVVGP